MTLATRPWAKGDLQDGRRKVRIALQSLGPPSSMVDQQFQSLPHDHQVLSASVTFLLCGYTRSERRR